MKGGKLGSGFRKSKCGFTLFELVATFSILAILAGLAISTYSFTMPAGALQSTQKQVLAMLRFAREQAIVNSSDSMFIVNYNSSDPDKFLRFMGVAVRDREDPTVWTASHRGVYLPDGVNFVPSSESGVNFDDYAAGEGEDDRKSRYNCSSSSVEAVGRLAYPLKDPVILENTSVDALGNGLPEEIGAPNWIGLQFDPKGRVKASSFSACSTTTPPSGNHLVIAYAEWTEDVLVFRESDRALAIKLRSNGISYSLGEEAEF